MRRLHHEMDSKSSYLKTFILAGRKPLFDQMWDFLHVLEVTKTLRLLGEYGIAELPVSEQRVMNSCVGIYDLVKDTGFKVHIGFEEGMKKTIEYYKK